MKLEPIGSVEPPSIEQHGEHTVLTYHSQAQWQVRMQDDFDAMEAAGFKLAETRVGLQCYFVRTSEAA